MITSQWRSILKSFNESSVMPEEEWGENTKANLHRFNKKNSVWALKGLFKVPNDKTIIVVGASPRLKEDVEKLKECDDDFRIFCVNSALKYLLKHGVKPHYIVAVDSDDKDIYEHLDVDSSDLTLIAGSSLSPRVLDNWKGKIWYLPYYATKPKLRPKVRARLGNTIPVGGNCLNTTVAMLMVVFGARIIILVGAECCYDKDYYVSNDIVRNNLEAMEFYCVDVDGKNRITTMALHTYKLWLEKLAERVSPHIKIVDTSFGLMGRRKDKSKIYVYELSEVIRLAKEAHRKKRERWTNAENNMLNSTVHSQPAG